MKYVCRTPLLLTVLLLLAPTAIAEVPPLLHYQGYLQNDLGEPVHCPDAETCPDGAFSVTVRLYDAAEDGDPLWSETHDQVWVDQGRFDIRLGSVVSLDPETLDDETWLSLEVGTDGELEPRQRVVSAAFAMKAAVAETAWTADDAVSLGGVPAGDFVQVNQVAGLCVTEADLDQVLIEHAYTDLATVEGYLTEQGFVPGPHFSGSFLDLTDVPEDLLDGDDDTLAGLDCAEGQVLKRVDGAWACADEQGAASIGSCPPGEVLTGVNADGEAECLELASVVGCSVTGADSDGVAQLNCPGHPPSGIELRPLVRDLHLHHPNLGGCGVRLDGAVFCWPHPVEFEGKYLQVIGYPGYEGQQFTGGVCALREDHVLVCQDQMPDDDYTHPPVGESFTSIAGDGEYGCGVRPDGTLSCWGPTVSLTGYPAPEEDFISIAIPDLARGCGLLQTGDVTCWGPYMPGPFSGPSSFNHFGISPTKGVGCGVSAGDNSLHCWGPGLPGNFNPPPGPFKRVFVTDSAIIAIRDEDSTAIRLRYAYSVMVGGNGIWPFDETTVGFERFVGGDDGGFCGIQTSGLVTCGDDHAPLWKNLGAWGANPQPPLAESGPYSEIPVKGGSL